MAVRSYGSDMDLECMCSDLDLGLMTLVQGHDTPLGLSSKIEKIPENTRGEKSGK